MTHAEPRLTWHLHLLTSWPLNPHFSSSLSSIQHVLLWSSAGLFGFVPASPVLGVWMAATAAASKHCRAVKESMVTPLCDPERSQVVNVVHRGSVCTPKKKRQHREAARQYLMKLWNALTDLTTVASSLWDRRTSFYCGTARLLPLSGSRWQTGLVSLSVSPSLPWLWCQDTLLNIIELISKLFDSRPSTCQISFLIS